MGRIFTNNSRIIVRREGKEIFPMKVLDYSKLRPPRPTLKKDICKCKGKRGIKLMASFLFWNPIHCINCNLEISPKSINLNQKLIDEIAYWAGLYGAVDQLWFDSNEYEAWAKRELTNIKSRINRLGLSVNRSMNKIQKSYYWYFQDESDENFIPFERCPECNRKLIDYNNGIIKQKICERCLIIGPG